MIYIRGHARDYDQWRQMGLAGWSYAEVLPYFKRAESPRQAGEDAYPRRFEGPLNVSSNAKSPTTPIYHRPDRGRARRQATRLTRRLQRRASRRASAPTS